MIEIEAVKKPPKIPSEIPAQEANAIISGSYEVLGKQNVTMGLSQEALRLLEEERKLFVVKDRTKALEILLRERREARKRKAKRANP
jgi:hypothetical protein